jgi:hypothetical protein
MGMTAPNIAIWQKGERTAAEGLELKAEAASYHAAANVASSRRN